MINTIVRKWIDPKTVNVKEHIKNRIVKFVYFRDGEFWYTTELGLLFPVPLHDVHGDKVKGQLLAEDKAIYFMRWINRYIKACKEDVITDSIPEKKEESVRDPKAGVIWAASGDDLQEGFTPQ